MTIRRNADTVIVELSRDEAQWLLDFLLAWHRLNVLSGGDPTDDEGTIPTALRLALL